MVDRGGGVCGGIGESKDKSCIFGFLELGSLDEELPALGGGGVLGLIK